MAERKFRVRGACINRVVCDKSRAMIRQEPATALITILNQVDEQEDIEVKTVTGEDVGRSVFETICALSNEPDLGGGTILLGVSRDESSLFPLYSANGVGNPDKLSLDIQSFCSSAFNSPIRVDIKTEAVGRAAVIRIDVPELPKSHKPAYFQATGLPKGAWRRIGPSDVRCNDDDLSTFYIGQSHEAYDTRLVKDADAADLDVEAIESYRMARAETSPDDEHIKWTDTDLLYALGATRKIEGKWRVTIAGMLMFGRSQAIRRCFPTMRVDYIRVPGNQWIPDAAASYESLDMRGPIIRLIPRVISAILDDLPRTFDVGDSLSGQRTETPAIPYRAIREAVVNSLMHRSYEGFSPIQIIRYANRLEIKNAGYSLKSQDRFDDAGSEIRNPTIAAMLHETRFAETKGSGIRVMQKLMVERGLASPTFNSDRERSEFSVSFLFHHFLNERDWDWLRSFAEFNLSEEQLKALIFVREVGAIDNSRYRSLNSVDTLTASKAMRSLCNHGLLAARGAGVSAHYLAGGEMIRRESEQARMATIPVSAPTSDATILGSKLRVEDLPLKMRTRVRTASMMARLEEPFARDVIYEICRWRPMTAAELADLLNKNRDYLSSRYVGPMVADGSLKYTIAEMPKHPDQRYMAGDKLNSKAPPK
ncbi:ATP-binding protein [Sphingomonas sp. AAP5]|uniref:ATP-binding protein n=1 Tax=Sphingomonas sp. AAP5 TaxID=1523415 RepID=UPI00140479DC|nr:ATP-binding protein [Sphingomonas sp. AAP5]